MVIISMSIPEKQKANIETWAKEYGISQSEMLRRILDAYEAQRKKDIRSNRG